MPRTASDPSSTFVGFAPVGSDIVDLYRVRKTDDQDAKDGDDYAPSGPPRSASFEGPMIDLLELLKHHEVQVAIIEKLPFPESDHPRDSDRINQFAQEVSNAVHGALIASGNEFADAEIAISDVVSSGVLAERMSALVPRLSSWNQEIGPFYDLAGAAWILGVSEDELAAKASSKQLLQLETADGVRVFPTFQFTADGRVYAGLSELIGIFYEADPWMLAAWLVSDSNEIGRAPMAALSGNLDFEPVLSIARQTAARWRR